MAVFGYHVVAKKTTSGRLLGVIFFTGNRSR